MQPSSGALYPSKKCPAGVLPFAALSVILDLLPMVFINQGIRLAINKSRRAYFFIPQELLDEESRHPAGEA
jgi:hypothetical protein